MSDEYLSKGYNQRMITRIKEHWLRAGFRRYIQNTGYLFLEKIIRTIVALVAWAMVARFLGAEQFGIFNYALSFVFLFKMISDLGLDDIVVRELVKNEENKNKILGTTFLLKFCGAVFAVICIALTLQVLSADSYTKNVVLIMSLRLLFQPFNNIDFYFRSKIISKYTVYSQLIALITTSLLCVIFIMRSMPLTYFVGIVVIEAAVTGLGLNILYLFNRQRISHWRVDKQVAASLLKDAWPMIVSGMAVAIYMRIDQIMINQMLDAASVGYYAAAVRASEVFYFVSTIITASFFPAIVNAKNNDPLQYENRIQALLSVLFWAAIVVSCGISFLSQPLVKFLYGPAFLPAAPILAIHVWANVFVFLGEARHKWAVNENLQIFTMYYLLLAALINVVLNLILIPSLGIQGAAIATVISQCVAAVLSNLFTKKTRPIFYLQLRSLNLVRALEGFMLKG